MNSTPQGNRSTHPSVEPRVSEDDIKKILYSFLMEYVDEKNDAERDVAIETATDAVRELIAKERAEERASIRAKSDMQSMELKRAWEHGEQKGRTEERNAVMEMIEGTKFQMDVEKYLQMVKAWDGKDFDVAFDHGYSTALSSLRDKLSTL